MSNDRKATYVFHFPKLEYVEVTFLFCDLSQILIYFEEKLTNTISAHSKLKPNIVVLNGGGCGCF